VDGIEDVDGCSEGIEETGVCEATCKIEQLPKRAKRILAGQKILMLTGLDGFFLKWSSPDVKSKERPNRSERRNQNECDVEGKEGYFVEVLFYISMYFDEIVEKYISDKRKVR
jgi:hypothetical protein